MVGYGIWTGKTPQELLESLKKAIEKQKGDKSPLGPIGVEMLEVIYTPRCNKELENAEKKGFLLSNSIIKLSGKGGYVTQKRSSRILLMCEIPWSIMLQGTMTLRLRKLVEEPMLT